MQATVAHVYQQIQDHLTERLAAATDPRAQLAAYIRAVVEFAADNRTAMQALSSIFLSFRDESGGSPTYDADIDQHAIGAVEQILPVGWTTAPSAHSTPSSWDP